MWIKHDKNVCNLFIMLFVKGVREKGSQGYLPIHFATSYAYAMPAEVTLKLLEVYPESASETVGNGFTLPIHFACVNKAPLEVIVKLLELYPEGAQAKTKSGFLPIHYAVRFQQSPEVILKLLELYPEGARALDGDGKHPIVWASNPLTEAPYEVLEKLEELYPRQQRIMFALQKFDKKKLRNSFSEWTYRIDFVVPILSS